MITRTKGVRLGAERLAMAAVLIGACWLGGCAGSSGKERSGDMAGETPMSAEEAVKALTGDWKLASINGANVVGAGDRSARDPSRAPGITISPDGGVSGFTGVNRMSSRLDVAKLRSGEFVLGGIATTRMAGPAGAMELESEFTSALGLVRRFAVTGGGLTLTGERGTVVKFVR
jgi:heat shock protein HslJ